MQTSSIPTYSTKTLLQELRTPELFVVMLIRLRAAAAHDPQRQYESWQQGLTAAGVSRDGSNAFDMLMQLLTLVLHWPLDVRSLRCGGLGEAEAWLLQAISLAQHDRIEAAESILSHWLPPGVSRIAAQHMARFAKALISTSLVIPLRHCNAAQLEAVMDMTSNRWLNAGALIS
ncbi:MAG: hypothetical protein JWM78_2600 [Verrucomicrobiaceae bacterium]|nr:hypothetical protein [Verrucomicrobiaceae bacterium]